MSLRSFINQSHLCHGCNVEFYHAEAMNLFVKKKLWIENEEHENTFSDVLQEDRILKLDAVTRVRIVLYMNFGWRKVGSGKHFFTHLTPTSVLPLFFSSLIIPSVLYCDTPPLPPPPPSLPHLNDKNDKQEGSQRRFTRAEVFFAPIRYSQL